MARWRGPAGCAGASLDSATKTGPLLRPFWEQVAGGTPYSVDEDEYRRALGHRVRRVDGDVTVIVPDDKDPVGPAPDQEDSAPEARESIRVQALLAEIGSRMGMPIWVPRADPGGVLAAWRGDHPPILERSPLNHDGTRPWGTSVWRSTKRRY